jgi:BirA family biotin operon repressor/biotin-[acetyl-CoA-carboxylase] ligase
MTAHFTNFIPLLASGDYYTANKLCKCLQITSQELADYLQQAQALGLQINFSENKGYRLRQPLDLINSSHIIGALTPIATSMLQSYQCLNVVTSTNELALQDACPDSGKFSFITAEMQTAGRGRRGRTWQSPYASNIYLSLIWPFLSDVSRVSMLSPYLAIEIVEMLSSLGIAKLGLKWPNDIFCNEKKIAGLLIESLYKSQQEMKLVIGLGINVDMRNDQAVTIDQEWTDIKSQHPGWRLSRSEFVARIINTLVSALIRFENKQHADLQNRWKRWDIALDQIVNVYTETKQIKGIAKGINEEGNLLLDVNGQLQKFIVGDVSLRAIK